LFQRQLDQLRRARLECPVDLLDQHFPANLGSISIGYKGIGYSQGQYAIGIGYNAYSGNYASNSIVLNASGNAIPANAGSLYVSPIRGATGSDILYYDPISKEITYGANSGGGGGGGGGTTLTWVSNGAPGASFNITGATGLSASNQFIVVAIATSGNVNWNNFGVSISGTNFSLSSSGTNLALFVLPTMMYTSGSIIQIMPDPSASAAMIATYWVSSGAGATGPQIYTTVSPESSPSANIYIPGQYNLSGMIILASPTSSINMTTATTAPSGWTSAGTGQHQGFSGLTTVAYQKATQVSSPIVPVNNPGFNSYNSAVFAAQ